MSTSAPNAIDFCRACQHCVVVNEASLCVSCAAMAAEIEAERNYRPDCDDCQDSGRIVYGRTDEETIDWDYCSCRKGRVRHQEALDRAAAARAKADARQRGAA